MLKLFTHLFVQTESSAVLLHHIGITNVSVVGDTRFDRVMDIVALAREVEEVKDFCEGAKVLIGGSTWEQDEKLLRAVYTNAYKLRFIIAPHEPSEANVKRLKAYFPDHVLFTDLLEGKGADKRVLIVDTVGHLSSIYRYANMAFIGGGFGKGIHNILEASAAGLPVMFGPKHTEFNEALELIAEGGAFAVENEKQLFAVLEELLLKPEYYSQCREIAFSYTKKRTGASRKVLSMVFS